MLIDNYYFYNLTIACITCCLLSFAVMMVIRYANRRSSLIGATDKRKRHPVLRLVLNLAALVPLSIAAALLLCVWWSLWRLGHTTAPETQLEMVIGGVVLYSLLLIGTVGLIRFAGKNKVRQGKEKRSHPHLRRALDIAAWIPFTVMVAFFVWGFTRG
jgi:hypothetical protein